MKAVLGLLIFVLLPLAFFYWIWRISKNPAQREPLSSFSALIAAAKRGNATALALLIFVVVFIAIIIALRLGVLLEK